MMGPTGITVVLAVHWLTGVVGAASLPPDDQYSPHHSPYQRDVFQGSLGYPNWLKYQQDLTTKLEPPDHTSGASRSDVSYFPMDRMARKNSVIRDLDILPLAPGVWKIADSADFKRNLNGSAAPNLGVPEDSKNAFASNDNDFVEDNSFQDQGPGSVEVYKLDLHRENPLLVPYANEKQAVMRSRMKSKIPKKAMAEEILWKLKSLETRKIPLPSVFRQPLSSRKNSNVSQKSIRKIEESRRDEMFAVGGVPELQVGCEGLEASEREKRSSEPGKTYDDDWDNLRTYKDPVYRESTEPILLRVTPIVLDIEKEEPPSGEIYEEMDELLKLKKLESNGPKPTTRRSNRADIDPALEADRHQEKRRRIETFPERGDLGPKSNGGSGEVNRSSASEDSKKSRLEKERFRRDTNRVDSPASFEIDLKDDKDVPWSPLSRTSSPNYQAGRKLLSVQYPERQEHRNQATSARHHRLSIQNQEDPDLWGFGENEGASFDSEDEADVDKLRQAEADKRRREYERRRQKELYRRREGVVRDQRPHSEDRNSRDRDVNTEIERIREEYERQLEKEQRERGRMMEERRSGDRKRGGEKDQRKIEEMRRRQEEESRRRLEEGRRKNRDPSNSRRQEEEEEEKRRRLEYQRNHEDPPAPLTRLESSNAGNMLQNQRNKDSEDQKLRDHIERNHPIDPKKTGDHRSPNEQSRNNEHNERVRYIEEQQKRRMEEERRRQKMEEHRRRQPQPHDIERKRQMEENRRRQQQHDEDEERRQMKERRKSQYQLDEHDYRRKIEAQQRRHQHDEEERRRQIEEQRTRDHPEVRAMEEERRRRLEEERKLQDYVRRNQPVIVPRRNNSQAFNSSSQESDLQEYRRTIEAARRWDRDWRPVARTDVGRMHGPSAPTNIGQRHSQEDLAEMRRKQERLEVERRWEMNRRIHEEEERKREAEYQRAESRKRKEERERLEEAVRRDEENRRRQSEGRRNSWQDRVASARPAGEVPDREAEALREREEARKETGNAMRNQEDEWRRRHEVGIGQQQQQYQEDRERHELENERNSKNNGRRRPQHLSPRQRDENVRRGHGEIEWRRREQARLNSLPISARIIIRSDDATQNDRGASSRGNSSTPLQPFVPSIGSKGNFNNDVDFPALNPNRPGLEAPRFPAPATSRPPTKSPGACVWAIVQCCPANNRLTTCFESMGCPGVNWDPNPCRGSLADAARAEVVRFYAAADKGNTRF